MPDRNGVRRPLVLVVATVGTAVALTFVGAVAFTPAPQPSASGTLAEGRETGRLEGLQERLRQRPGDWRGWATLGNLYVEQARVTADPSYYGRAEEAFERSLQVRPEDNADAVTGQAALAAARHDFAAALSLAERGLQIDSFNPEALAVMGDALIELGRYDEAFAVLEELNTRKPGLAAYSRASYAWELRGDIERATAAMQMALQAANTTGESTFAAYQLGQLAFGQGDLDTAAARFAEGLRRDPGSPTLLAGRARVAAARGDIDAALRDYTASVEKVPQPGILAELGDLYASLGRDEQAQEQYAVVGASQQLLAASGQDVDLELALFDADHGEPVEALEAAEAAYEARQSIFAEDALAWALHRNGRPEEALPHAQAALRLGTRDATLHYHLGMIHATLGDAEAAQRELEEALAINPYFSTVQVPLLEAELASLKAAERP